MRVGDSLEVPYDLPGGLPAGSYLVSATGTPSHPAQIHVDLLWRQPIGDTPIVSGDGATAGLSGRVDLALPAPAVATACGDQLVMRLKLVSSTQNYSEFMATLTTP